MNQVKFLLGLIYLLMVLSCQTAPKVVEAPAQAAEPTATLVEDPSPEPDPAVRADAVLATKDGFSPLASSPANELFFEMQWAKDSPSTSWSVAFHQEAGETVRTLSGTGTVPSIKWDGRDSAGALVPQGRYLATLSIDEGGTFVVKDSSMPFFVDIVPPSGTIAVNPLPYRVSDTGSPVSIKLDITVGGAPWTLWRLAVVHPDGRRFRDFISEENRDDDIEWNGRALNNAALEAGITYRLEAEVFDVYGNRGTLVGGLPVLPALTVAQTESKPIQVSVMLDGNTLAALPVWFGPNTADLSGVDEEKKSTNRSSLEQLAELLNSAPSTKVKVVGHANQVLYEDAAKAAVEQQETLLPLSEARAETVRTALISLGVGSDRLLVEGVGAEHPLVAFDDADNRWKNRRVVIVLENS